jgi:hypothetical protein
MVDDELLVQEARRDTSVRVTEQEVQDAVEQSVQNVRRGFASETEFQSQLRAAGFASQEEWRRWLADQQRRQIYGQRLLESLRQAGKLRSITPTDEQVRQMFDANRGTAQDRPPSVSFRQIVTRREPTAAPAKLAGWPTHWSARSSRARTSPRWHGAFQDSARGPGGSWVAPPRRDVKELSVAFAMRPPDLGAGGDRVRLHDPVDRSQPAEVSPATF